jgi:peptidylprolyl isomerase
MRRLLIAPVLLSALALSACGHSAAIHATTPAGASGARSTTTAPPSTTTAPPSTTTTSATSTTATTGGSGGSETAVPAVAEPTNLSTEPVVSGGSQPPPTKLVTRDLVVGTGTVATASSTVDVKYVGASYTTGKDFTSSTWTDNKPTSFSLDTVVPGFAEGIVGMKIGGRREIVIPPSLGYGSSGAGATIKPNETLVFVVDLTGVS